MAMVGTGSVEPLPIHKETPERSVEFVQVPLDVVLKYLYKRGALGRSFRTTSTCCTLPTWTALFCAGNDTLKHVIQLVYKERDSTGWPWLCLLCPVILRHEEPGASNAPNAGGFARELRDGTRLCQAWQTGKCTDQAKDSCRNGKHRCALVFRSGRVCGSPEHRGDKCRFKKRA